MRSKNLPAMVVAVLVVEDEADVPSKDAAIDEGSAKESGFWNSGWWDAKRGCTIPDTNCRRTAILFESSLNISAQDAVEDVVIGGGSTGDSEV